MSEEQGKEGQEWRESVTSDGDRFITRANPNWKPGDFPEEDFTFGHLQELLAAARDDKARIRELEDGIREQGKCFHCQGTGKPNCVTCHNYQGCICRPGEGRYAESCWNCKGSGVNAWVTALLSSSPVAQGGTDKNGGGE